MYVIETVDGTELLTYAGSLAEATRAAVSRLEDDPELGELLVYEIGRGRPTARHPRPGVFDLRRQLGRAPTAQEYRDAGDWDTPPHARHVKTVTHAPDANWNSIVVTLNPDEKIKPPGYVPRQITEDDLEGYDLGDPKRISLERMIGKWV